MENEKREKRTRKGTLWLKACPKGIAGHCRRHVERLRPWK